MKKVIYILGAQGTGKNALYKQMEQLGDGMADEVLTISQANDFIESAMFNSLVKRLIVISSTIKKEDISISSNVLIFNLK